mmetsp:Transcript_16565/g.35996  ORF Transcript_16565/g.35996 Transcript_16565/m.35996 type:complete len:239 (+) Transcript_16565:161-877(+)
MACSAGHDLRNIHGPLISAYKHMMHLESEIEEPRVKLLGAFGEESGSEQRDKIPFLLRTQIRRCIRSVCTKRKTPKHTNRSAEKEEVAARTSLQTREIVGAHEFRPSRDDARDVRLDIFLELTAGAHKHPKVQLRGFQTKHEQSFQARSLSRPERSERMNKRRHSVIPRFEFQRARSGVPDQVNGVGGYIRGKQNPHHTPRHHTLNAARGFDSTKRLRVVQRDCDKRKRRTSRIFLRG